MSWKVRDLVPKLTPVTWNHIFNWFCLEIAILGILTNLPIINRSVQIVSHLMYQFYACHQRSSQQYLSPSLFLYLSVKHARTHSPSSGHSDLKESMYSHLHPLSLFSHTHAHTHTLSLSLSASFSVSWSISLSHHEVWCWVKWVEAGRKNFGVQNSHLQVVLSVLMFYIQC
jgi:hypothetical protein